MKKIFTAGILILLTIISTQCRKTDTTYNGNGGTGTVNKAPITATLQGKITDENGQPSSGVIITVGDKTATTDNNGYFRIMAAALDKNVAFVAAQKTGYFNAYRSFCATSGTNQIAIQLIKKTLAGSINAASGGTITLSNGAKIALPANGVVNASSNAAYSGTVNVYAAYIDPSNNTIAKTIPGSFMANDKNNNRVTLASYGMLAIELQSSDGQKLQIATGNTAILTTPIPTLLQAKAPATISMWYLNEQTGLWQEEGTATKNGGNYIGTVKHFSFWNCDYPYPTLQISAIFKTADGLPIVNGYIRVRFADTSNYSYGAGGYTDSVGMVSGLVPATGNFVIEMLNQCYAVVYSKNIGTISSNTDLGTITIPSTTTAIVTIKGKLVTCNNLPVSDGYAILNYQYGGQYVQCNSNGEFTTTLVQCAASSYYEVTGIDNSTHQKGASTSITSSASSIDLGNIKACGDNVPYILTIIGRLVDCNSQPVTGAATINYQGYNIIAGSSKSVDSTGYFYTTIYYNPDTSGNCQFSGINTINNQQGSVKTIDISTFINGSVANIGNITACGTSVNAPVTFTLDGIDYKLLPPPLSTLYAYDQTTRDSIANNPPTLTYIKSSIADYSYYDNTNIQFTFMDASAANGSFPLINLSVNYETATLIQPFNVIITKYPQTAGENYEGTFSGQFKDGLNNIHTISCSFKQPRAY